MDLIEKDRIGKIDIENLNFHSLLKDIENIFWFFLLSMRTLSDYDIQNILRTKNSTQEGYQSFNQMLDKFNKTTGLHIEKKGNILTSKLNILKEMIFIGKAMAILAYELLLSSNYNEIINKDNEFQFLRHIRNGAAHNNKFNLKNKYDKWTISENEVIKWNDMEISRKLQGKEVFNNFISIIDIFLLVEHFSERLTEIDNK